MKFNIQKNLSLLAAKNTLYNYLSTFISKVGGFVLTILLARMLLPDLFGVYSLVLSIVVIVFSFIDLGIGEAAIRYMSESLGKNKRNEALSYFWYLFNVRFILIIFGALGLFLFAKLFAYDIFGKQEIVIPLLFAIFFVLVNAVRNFFGILFFALNDLRDVPFVYTILHGSKVLFSFIALLLFSGVEAVSAIFAAFAASSFVSLISIIIILKRKKFRFFPKKKIKFNKKKTWEYLGFMSIINISLIMFGSVDTLMLGRFVDTSYVGYYHAAFSVIISLVAIFTISGIFLPIFTQVNGDRLKKAISKSMRYTLIISVPSVVGILFVSEEIISFFYGSEYSNAVGVLLALSLILFVTPISSLYSNLLKAKDRTKILATITVMSLILNVVLNYILITYFLKFSQEYAIIGAALATVISRTFLLVAVMADVKKQFKMALDNKPLLRSIIASAIMALVLYIYEILFTEIAPIFSILEVIIGVVTYFFVMVVIKEVNKEDLNLLKTTLKNY